jgi:thioredoxin 1
MAERITAENFSEKALEQDLALIEFYSDSCVPCKRMSPILGELEETYGDKLYVGKVNVAYDTSVAEQYEVSKTPTFLLFKKGEQVEKLLGAQKKADMTALVEANL